MWLRACGHALQRRWAQTSPAIDFAPGVTARRGACRYEVVRADGSRVGEVREVRDVAALEGSWGVAGRLGEGEGLRVTESLPTYIYAIETAAGERVYVGSTYRLERRVQEHVRAGTLDVAAGDRVAVIAALEDAGREAVQAAERAEYLRSLRAGCELRNLCPPYIVDTVAEVDAGAGEVGEHHPPTQNRSDAPHAPRSIGRGDELNATIASVAGSSGKLLEVRPRLAADESDRTGPCVYEVRDEAGRRVFVGGTTRWKDMVRSNRRQGRLRAGWSIHVVSEHATTREMRQAAKASYEESRAHGDKLLNTRYPSNAGYEGPFVYEVRDKADRRVFVGGTTSWSDTEYSNRHRGHLRRGWSMQVVSRHGTREEMRQAAEECYKESMACGDELKNIRSPAYTSCEGPCVYEVRDEAGLQVFIGGTMKWRQAVADNRRRGRLLEGWSMHVVSRHATREEMRQAVKECRQQSKSQNNATTPTSQTDGGGSEGPCVYEVRDEGGRRVFVGGTTKWRQAVYDNRRHGRLLEGWSMNVVSRHATREEMRGAVSELRGLDVDRGGRMLNKKAPARRKRR